MVQSMHFYIINNSLKIMNINIYHNVSQETKFISTIISIYYICINNRIHGVISRSSRLH